jgi:hypothetical protein
MTAFIVIDRSSGYIFYDTRDLNRSHIIDGEAMQDEALTPALACRWGDETVAKEFGRTYTETNPFDARATYDVFRADVCGSEAVPVVQDGQDREMIEAVERDCQYVTSIKIEGAES